MDATLAVDWQEDHAQLRYGDSGILRLVDRRSTADFCAGSLSCFDVLRQRTVSGAIFRRVLRNTLPLLPVKRQAALACVDGVLFSAAGWCGGQLQRSASSVFSMLLGLYCFVLWRMSSLGQGVQRMRSSESSLKVPSTSLVLQAARLRYLPRQLRHAPPSPPATPRCESMEAGHGEGSL